MPNTPLSALTTLWNNAGTVFNAIKMNVTNSASAAGSKIITLQVGGTDKFTVDKDGNVVAAGTVSSAGAFTSGGAVLPPSNDGGALGASGFAFSDLFLASGGVINWAAADVTITHSPNLLAFAGASSGYSFDAAVKPSANDAAALGVSGTAWADLFLASGAVINFAAANVVMTHSNGVLTLGTGDLRVTTPGTNSESVVTISGTQTLTGKTLTQPVLTLKQGATATPTAEGVIEWDTDDDVLAVGDGAATKLFLPAPASTAAGDIEYYTAAKVKTRLAKGTAGQALKTNSGATAPEWAAASGAPDIVLENQQTSGTGGGSLSVTMAQVPINTEVRDNGGIISISANRFTPTVNMWIEWSQPGYLRGIKTQIYDVTNTAVVAWGSYGVADSGPNTTSLSTGGCLLTGGVQYEMRAQGSGPQATTGLGVPSSMGTEVYGRIVGWRTT